MSNDETRVQPVLYSLILFILKKTQNAIPDHTRVWTIRKDHTRVWNTRNLKRS